MEHTLSLLVGAWSWFLSSLLGFGGTSVTRAVLKFLNEGVLAEERNLTTVVLVPKVRNP
jgi:hypothetical protein